MGSFELKPEKLPSSSIQGRVSPRLETQLNSHTAIHNAHNYFGSGAEAHALAAHPALVPGTPEPISPLIQMIMRMPGHIGIFNSFFEALQSLIMPHLDFLPHLDPSLLAAHAHEAAHSAVNAAAEHAHIDLGALPAEAHIFEGLQMDGPSQGLTEMGKHLSQIDLSKQAMQVSGTPDLGKPIYEGAGGGAGGGITGSNSQSDGALAGPALSDHGISNHLAGPHRVFSHALFERPASAMNTPLTASAQGTTSAASNSLSTGQYSPLHVNGNPFAPQPSMAPASGDGQINAGFRMGAPTERTLGAASTLGPSGAVSEQLGSKHLLASGDGVETFRPSMGSDASAYDASNIQEQAGAGAHYNALHQAPLQGLRAKELTLNDTGKLAHSDSTSSHFRSVSGDQNGNGAGHLKHVGKPLTNVKDQIAHRSLKPSDSSAATTRHVAHLPKPASAGPTTTSPAGDAPTTTADQPSSYVIRSGDCLWNIAKDKLGDATKWQDIYNLNADKLGSNPDLIHPGTSIQLPNASQDLASHGINASKYVVRSGDNLWNISKHVLGSGDKWGQLYHLNTDVIGSNPRLILPGQELTLPGSEAIASNTAAPVGDAVATQATAPTNLAESVQSQPATAVEAAPQAGTAEAPPAISGDANLGAPVLPAQGQVLSGPGGAQAATPTTDPTSSDPSVVSSSLAPDLSFFTKAKR